MDLVHRPIYRLGNIEIDTGQGCLKRSGQEQFLRQQSFDVLLYLLEQRQRLVAKEELIETIWRNTAVTDNALVQCIVEIRKALGDDSRHPRFIKTIPKLGYRFIAPVEEHSPANNGPALMFKSGLESENSPMAYGSGHEAAAPAARQRITPTLAIGCSLMVVLVLGGIFWFWSRTVSVKGAEVTLPQLPGKKTVAVMYFENQSGRADLNWLREGLADMLITDLAHSDQLTVLSRQQLYSLLERIGHKQGEKIGLDEALDIGRRAHAEAIVLGSFAVVDQRIRIHAQLHEIHDGHLMAADRIIADNPSQILTQVDVLSLQLADHLGVTPRDHGKETSLSQMMTDNLEAYQYYSLGVEKARAFQNAQAIAQLNKAIGLDPHFAMAYARIGYAYAVTDFQPDKARPYLEKAFQLSANLTAKDRLYIMAWYAIAQGDYEGAVKTYRQIVHEYPLETEAYRGLGRVLLGEEQSEKAIEVIKEGLAIDPEGKYFYNGLGMVLLGLRRYDEAITAHRRYVDLAPNEPNSHDSLGMSYQQSGRYAEGIEQYNSALSLDPTFEPAIIHLGDVYFQQGRYQDAVRQYRRYINVTHSDLARALGYRNIAFVYWRQGEPQRADEAIANEKRYEKGAAWNSLLVALQQTDRSRAESLKDNLLQSIPSAERGAGQDLRIQEYFRGYLELKAGNSDAAIVDFKEALRHLPPTSGMDLYEDCLANAYLKLGRLDDAIAEYQSILKLNPNYPLAEYHLAQAYERKGEQAKAYDAYQRFLRIWSTADSNVPETVEARAKLSYVASDVRALVRP
jgi:tetratricopeptide (TPR) repeat protein/DNA-binding winged helix-turn-helix (wHTH) protein